MFRSCVRERMPEGGSEGRDAAGLDRIGAQSASDRREVRRSEPIKIHPARPAKLLLEKSLDDGKIIVGKNHPDGAYIVLGGGRDFASS